MKDLLLSAREYMNFSLICRKRKIYHETYVIHGRIHILANSDKLTELGYL